MFAADAGGSVTAKFDPTDPDGNTALTAVHVNAGICVVLSAAQMALAEAMPLANPDREIKPL